MQAYNQTLRNYFLQFRGLSSICSFAVICALIFVFSVTSAAQDSDLEKSLYKNGTPDTKKSNPPAPKSTPAPRRSNVTQPTPRRSNSKPTPQPRTATRRASNTPATILFTFVTPDPVQEVWLGEQKLGLSNNDAILDKQLKPGNYLVSVRNSAGAVVVESQIVTVSSESKKSLLIPDNVAGPEKITAASLQNESEESVEASEKILAILQRYGNPQHTKTVSRADWDFVYELARANEIKGFTALQIEAQRWFASGQIELAKGNYPGALTSFEKAKEYMPESAYPDYAIAETYLANKQPADALRFYTSAAAIQPKFSMAHAKIGDLLATAGKSKEAAVSYSLALEHGYNSSEIRFSLAKEQLKNKRYDEAAKLLEIVLKEMPTAEVYVTLGDTYKELKRPISTYESYLRATVLSPESAVAFFKLGEILLEEREFEKARIALARAIELDNKGQTVNIALTRKYLRDAEQKLNK